MGNKRPHPGGGATGRDYENPDRKRLRTGRAPKPRPQKVHNADTDGLNAIKKRARAIERLLARDNLKLPANKLNDLERELAAHKLRIEDARTKKERSKMIQKYHMVRFFERKKAMRFAKQLEKKLAQATDPEEVSQLKSDLHIAQVDIDYAIYYPFMEAYISLYAVLKGDKEEKEEKDEKEEKGAAAKYLRTPRPPMWSVIEKTREKGEAALVKLQSRRPQQASEKPGEKDAGTEKRVPATKGTKKGASSQKAKASAKSRQAEEETGRTGDDDEDSDSDDGGFFE